MVFQDYKINGDTITLTKKELEDVKEHFLKVADETQTEFHYAFYSGKADMIRDILKMFDPIQVKKI